MYIYVYIYKYIYIYVCTNIHSYIRMLYVDNNLRQSAQYYVKQSDMMYTMTLCFMSFLLSTLPELVNNL